MTDSNEQIITLTDEEGNETEFYVIGDLEIEGKVYVALEPVENDNDEYVILRVEADENGDETLVTIDNDEEFDKAAEAFENEFMSELDLDEAYDEDEDVEETDGEDE
ncbi:MAG: DUF1292 domain-containing protein [Clostridiales bacterium]|jgi:putative Holliday junction resolvase|nr:DUF1292 domain-containing protein [Clostridiales bacterium]